VNVKEGVRAQADEPTTTHTGEKERKKEGGQEQQIYKLAFLEHPMPGGNALVAGTRAKRGIAFRDTSPRLWRSHLTAFSRPSLLASNVWRHRIEKKVHRLQEGAGSLQGCDQTVRG
jgi:hypothetical protein